jgi:hypothetical protein
MGERLKPAVLKTVYGETRTGVRIPLPPPCYLNCPTCGPTVSNGLLLRSTRENSLERCSGREKSRKPIHAPGLEQFRRDGERNPISAASNQHDPFN